MTSRKQKTHIIEVWGDFACISRPELKVERWSYPCLTPSAARGIFDAIFCKPGDVKRTGKPPQFRWQITRIEVLKHPQYIALRRNEVSARASAANVKKWMKGTAQPEPLAADDSSLRQQRQTMALRDVRYRIHGHILPWPGFEERQRAFDEQFRRRAASGKCVWQPYLGCREFVAFFKLIEDEEQARSERPPVDLNQDVGMMIYDVFDLSQPGTSESEPLISVFPAQIKDGVLEVPAYDDPIVRKPERRAG